jgi:O-antigen ligase
VASGGRRSIRGVLFVLFTVLFAALLATLTRTFLAALLVSCGATFWLSHKRIRLVALIGLMVAVAVATVWIRKERGYGWLAPKDAGTEYREQMWRDSLHIIPHHLLFGVGPDSVLQFGDEWNVAAYKKFQLRSHFHSTYIQLAVDCGLPCLVAWCWLMSAYLIFVWRCWRRSANWDWFSRGLILGVLGGTVGFVLASFVHYTLGDGEVMVILWLLMGLAIAVARLNGVGDVSSPKYSGTG